MTKTLTDLQKEAKDTLRKAALKNTGATGRQINDLVNAHLDLYVEKAYNLGVQKGKNAAVDYILEKAPATEVPLLLPAGVKIHPVLPSTLTEART